MCPKILHHRGIDVRVGYCPSSLLVNLVSYVQSQFYSPNQYSGQVETMVPITRITGTTHTQNNKNIIKNMI